MKAKWKFYLLVVEISNWSRTAAKYLKIINYFYAKSAGFSESPVKISWTINIAADLILLMEYEHSKDFVS